jgi:hypothetical protein
MKLKLNRVQFDYFNRPLDILWLGLMSFAGPDKKYNFFHFFIVV